MRRFFKNLLLLTLSSLAALVLLEFAVRWALPRFDPSGAVTFRLSAERLPLGPPNSVRRQFKGSGDYDVQVAFNRYGLRDRRDLALADAADWFAVGDSYSFGWGVEEPQRYSDVLEKLLGGRVFNLSAPTDLPGYAGLVDYAARLGAPVRKLIIGVCMENDLLDYGEPEPPGGPGGAADMASTAKAWLSTRSALYHAVATAVHQRPALRALAIRLGLVVENIAGMRRNRYSRAIIASSAEALVRLAEGHEAIVLIIPSRGLWVGGNQPHEARVHDDFVTALRQAGLAVVDMRPLFEATGDPLQFHFANDGHWNVRGHRAAAEALRDRISGGVN